MAATYETSFASTARTYADLNASENYTIDAGTGSDRVLIVAIFWADIEIRTVAMTYNGVAMTSVGTRVTTTDSFALQLFRLANPASGSNTLNVTMTNADGSSTSLLGAWIVNATDGTVDGFNSNSGAGSTANLVSSVTISGDSGDRIFVCHCTRHIDANITATPTGYTERQDATDLGGLAMEFGDADGSASLNTQATWNNGASAWTFVAAGLNVNQTATGRTTHNTRSFPHANALGTSLGQTHG